jgi:hypothetical protein
MRKIYSRSSINPHCTFTSIEQIKSFPTTEGSIPSLMNVRFLSVTTAVRNLQK